jgi:hypothetical protein
MSADVHTVDTAPPLTLSIPPCPAVLNHQILVVDTSLRSSRRRMMELQRQVVYLELTAQGKPQDEIDAELDRRKEQYARFYYSAEGKHTMSHAC